MIPRFLFFLLFSASSFFTVFAATTTDRSALETQLVALENQITEYESTVADYRKQGKNLQSAVRNFDTQIHKLDLQIRTVELTIKKLDSEIVENGVSVLATEKQLERLRAALGNALQLLAERDSTSNVEAVLRYARLSDFFSSLYDLVLVQDQLRTIVQKTADVRDALTTAREELLTRRSDASTLRQYHDVQKKRALQLKQEKNALLAATKGKETKYQELLSETRKNAAQIRSQIFEFLGGGELTFGDAYKFAKIAETATGVRAALILAVLDRESALGQNVGKCGYRNAMHPTRDIPIYLALTQALGINPETMTVSCANRDGLYGGAMGPAQFIPSTWNLYSSRVSDITGNNPASPWRNGDAFVATALYLKDSGVRSGSSIVEERKAAARYYAGARWQRYLWTYGDRVITRAQQFQQDIDVLSG